MSGKKLLTAFLLGVGLCFVPALGYGEIKNKEFLFEIKATKLDVELLVAQFRYIMMNPESFLGVSYFYDEIGWFAEEFPVGVSTKGKICVTVFDNRNVFSDKTGAMLLLELETQGSYVSYFLKVIVSDMDNDIVVRFMDNFGEPLGYFYQGEYHLWEE